MDVKPVKNLEALRGKDLDFKVISVDKKRGNIVLSRKAVVEVEQEARKKEHDLLERLRALPDGQQKAEETKKADAAKTFAMLSDGNKSGWLYDRLEERDASARRWRGELTGTEIGRAHV